MRETKVPVQELWLKMRGGGLMREGGVWAGFYGLRSITTTTGLIVRCTLICYQDKYPINYFKKRDE